MARNEYFTFRSLVEMRERVAALGLQDEIGFETDVSPEASGRQIGTPVSAGSFELPNRFVALPMEGWDGDPATGAPTGDVLRRWERIGTSGVGLAWGLEAFAVGHRYRAHGRQLVMLESNAEPLARGLKQMRSAHKKAFGDSRGLKIGAQLTCSGRYCFGAPKGEPLLLVYHHPELDRRVGASDETPLTTDMELENIVGEYAAAARVARAVGFDFIDIKACHRYWINETLAAKTRPGPYGGSFENRAKILLMIVDAVRREVGAEFPLACRLNAYDGIPFEEDPDTRREGLKGRGRASEYATPYVWGFGVDEMDPYKPDLREPLVLIGLLKDRNVGMFNISGGSPYSNPHLLRPTESPPVDGYQPFWDPLHEVAMHFALVRAVKEAHDDVTVVGSGYSYLRQFKAHAAEYNLKSGRVDMVGLGRALLSYPDEVRRILETGVAKPEKGRMVCTGDSACTTGPRFGLKSGCIYDPYYRDTNRAIQDRLAMMGLTRK